MTTPSFYTDGQGKGHLPLQPHPKNKTKAVYTEELTHLVSFSQRAVITSYKLAVVIWLLTLRPNTREGFPWSSVT